MHTTYLSARAEKYLLGSEGRKRRSAKLDGSCDRSDPTATILCAAQCQRLTRIAGLTALRSANISSRRLRWLRGSMISNPLAMSAACAWRFARLRPSCQTDPGDVFYFPHGLSRVMKPRRSRIGANQNANLTRHTFIFAIDKFRKAKWTTKLPRRRCQEPLRGD